MIDLLIDDLQVLFGMFYCYCKVGTLEQTRLQLEARLFDSMKEVKEENVERESKINRSILVIHEQYGKTSIYFE